MSWKSKSKMSVTLQTLAAVEVTIYWMQPAPTSCCKRYWVLEESKWLLFTVLSDYWIDTVKYWEVFLSPRTRRATRYFQPSILWQNFWFWCQNPQVMMSSLARAFNRDSGTFLFILDEMLRRGLISVTAAADWLTRQTCTPAKHNVKCSFSPWI